MTKAKTVEAEQLDELATEQLDALATEQPDALATEQPKPAKNEQPVIFMEGIDTLLRGANLVARAKEGATWLIFANYLHSIPGVTALPTGPDDWRDEGKKLIFAGDLTVTVNDQARGDALALVALADSPDGPVLALCDVAGEIPLTTGQVFRFGPGAFVFG